MSKTFREKVIDDIFTFGKQESAFDLIEAEYGEVEEKIITKELIQVGIMPEVFEHDSTEEKLWSKFSDIILARTLTLLGLDSEVIRTRGNSADVLSKAEKYTLVSDAKCFRLSRTAKNQKDFKIKALDDWRKQNTYALLVAPLSQYPADRSQIYQQAISHHVTLLSYVHLQFLVEKGIRGDLENLWNITSYMSKEYKPQEQRKGLMYWQTVDKIVCRITNQSTEILKKYKQKEIDKTKEIGQEGINYWNSKIAELNKLSRKQAINLLIKSQRIEQKIETIRKAIEKVHWAFINL